MALAKGYDVSDYQSSIPADAQFVIIKASEGARTIQSGYRAKVATARARGLVLGHYHFLHAEQDVQGEVDHFCSVVGDVPASELLVLDFEPYNQGVADAKATAQKNAWLAAVKKRYPKNLVGTYTNIDYWRRTDDNAGDFLWIADYQKPAGSPGIQAAWRIHQYTDRPLDTNVFNGSIDEMRAWAGSGAGPTKPPAGKPSWQRLVDHVLSIPEGDYETYRPGIGWDNRTRFGKQFGEDGVAWCVVFDWCMYADVGLDGIVPKTDNVDSFTAWAKARGQWSEYPSLGAWANIGNGAHTEIVVGFTDTTVTTKGGNTIPVGGDGGQGRGVYTHTYRRTDPRIVGYLAPRFPDGRPPSADPEDPRPVMAAAQEDDPMAGMTANDIYDAVWNNDRMIPPDGAATPDNPTWQPMSVLLDAASRVRALQGAVAAQTAAIQTLAGMVGTGVDTAAVVAAVQSAIAEAVVHVDVDVTGKQVGGA